jgi:hypothetical protein
MHDEVETPPDQDCRRAQRVDAGAAPQTSSWHLPTLFQRPDRLHDPLYVLTVVFNSPRYRTRVKLYQDFARMVELTPAAELYTVEVAFGDRDFAVTRSDHPRHLQLRTSSEIWHKERALNLLAQRLPRDWRYVAWIDADVAFARHDWADETRHLLQHFSVLQMWTQALDLNSRAEAIGEHRSFCHAHLEGMELLRPGEADGYYGRPGKLGQPMWWHPGYCWAARREAWDGLGGLLDVAILGAADSLMAYALLGRADAILPNGSPRYRYSVRQWEARARHHIRGNIGAMRGLLLHHWHGPKAQRRYSTRGQILAETSYDPDRDLVPDWQGLYQLSPRSPALRDRVRTYFHERDEDAP